MREGVKHTLREMMQNCDFIDMWFQGNRFPEHHGSSHETLDCMLINMQLHPTFSKGTTFHLPRETTIQLLGS